MPKMKKEKKSLGGAAVPKNMPLDEQMQSGHFAASSTRVKDRGQRRHHEPEAGASDAAAGGDGQFVAGDLSQRILSQARLQLKELEEETEDAAADHDSQSSKKKVTLAKQHLADDDDDASDADDDDDGVMDVSDLATELRINPREESQFNMFMNQDAEPRMTLNEIIAQKIAEKRTEIETQFTDTDSLKRQDLDPRVVEMYEGVGQVLAKYRSGKVPKAFKVIPQFRNWEDLLFITQPDKWSAAAVFRATKIFVANLKTDMAQRFFNQILLPRVRDDIDTYQRLNFHLYQALRKALFKPGAFFKGFLLPLCESGNCTLREAIILGSVLAKNSIPVLHSCAVMLKIAEMDYTGANSIFLRIFLDKKYALPYRVVDALVFHFLKFRTERRELPVLWHQAFLTFVQRYKGHVSSEQRDALLEILKVQAHHKITPEIRRELANAKCRDLEAVEPPMAQDADMN